MIPLGKWVEREFNYNLKASLYPVLVERLLGTPARLTNKINNAPYLILTQPYKNGWSIQEHAGHLIDLESLLSTRLDDFEKNIEILTPADMTNQKTDDANYNQQNINDILKEFQAARTATINRIENYDEEMVLRTSLHPRLNRDMMLINLIHFFAEHDDHHLAMINRIIKDVD